MDVERIVPRPLARAVIVGIVAAAGVGTAAAQGGPYERQKVDPAAATRGRAVYAQHCIPFVDRLTNEHTVTHVAGVVHHCV